MFSPRARDLALTCHVVTSLGWLGAVLVFLVLAISGATSSDPAAMRAAYVAMELIGWRAIVPLCGASLATGIVQSLGTKWGLAQHYWVLIKLVLTVIATLLLLLHTRVIEAAAAYARANTIADDVHHGLRVQLVFDAAAALVLLVVATVLAVYKPRGVTRYGRRR
jgi:hypothetical protein